MMKNKKDDLGNRIKEYESVTNYKLIRKGYTIIRIDGKAFHTYTKGLDKPFDNGLIEDMDNTGKYLCKNIQNVVCGYVQSDEITLVLCDFDKPTTSAWFDNKIQKMASVSASMATAKFNQLRSLRDLTGGLSLDDYENYKLAEFDARVFQVPNKIETINMLIWRQQDTTRNSISSVAQSMFSHRELHNKSTNQMQEMMFQKDGTNWNDFDAKLKRGRMIVKESYEKEEGVIRTRWVSQAPPIFTKDRNYLDKLIPNRDEKFVEPIKVMPDDLTKDEIENLIESMKKQILTLNETLYNK